MFYVKEIMDFSIGPVWCVYRPNGQMRSSWFSKAKADLHAAQLNTMKG